MLLLETKEKLTIIELLEIAYDYGNRNSDMPTDPTTSKKDFDFWINDNNELLNKLILE